MDPFQPPPDALIVIAAMMRAAGQSWEAVGAEVDRHAETVRRWPERYPDQWRKAFRRAETQCIAEAGTEARTTLRIMLRAKRGRNRIAAAAHLTASNDRARSREPQSAEPGETQCPSCQLLATMSDEELDRMLERFRCHENDELREDGAGI